MAGVNVVWPNSSNPIWTFNYELSRDPDKEGLKLRNGVFRGRQVFYKISLPLVRVQYYRPWAYFWMGPFVDPLQQEKAVTTATNPYGLVVVETRYGGRALHLGVYYIISSYHLYESYHFWDTGHIIPSLYSKGLQYPYSHTHHVYWRFDFDIEGAGNNQFLEWNSNTGWFVLGPGEDWSLKDPNVGRAWQVRNRSTGRGYTLYPGPNDGVADSFSRKDIWHLAYRYDEDRGGRQGDAHDDKLDQYLTGDPTDGRDVVWWYCGHLFHHRDEPAAEWHSVGPTLSPVGY
jgi:hypothetical protein